MKRDFFIKTERVGFSIWKENDTQLAELLWGEAAVTRYICSSGKFSSKDIADRLKKEIDNDIQYSVQYWPFFELTSGKLIGCCGLRPHNKYDYEIGFHLRSEFWGRGYAVEAANTVINYAFSVLNAKSLFAGHNPENAASAKVLSKLKFRCIGEEFYEPTGLYHPSYLLKENEYKA